METAANELCDDRPVIVERDAAGRLLPGSIINPTGKRGKTFSQRAREAGEAAVSPEKWAQYLRELDGIATQALDPKDRMAAIKILHEYAGVNAAQKMDVAVHGPTIQEQIAADMIEWRERIEAEEGQ